MATKPKAILSTHDGREASPVTKASNVLFENGQTAQDILNDRQDAMISPVIENSSSMFKVGQGDSVDYSENVVDGAYESCVLKGNTKVNLIQEPSSQDVVLPYEFAEGQSVTINDTKKSGALGVELKGQTKYKDINTGDILDEFDSNKSLELVSVQAPSVTTVGKNILAPHLLNHNILNSVKNYSGFDFTYNSDGTFTVNGTNTVEVTLHCKSEEFIKLLVDGETYSVPEGMLIETIYNDGTPPKWTRTSTYEKNRVVRFSPYFQWMKGATLSNKKFYPMVEVGSVSTTYEPYKSTTLTTPEEITLRGIGNVTDTLNTVTGELTQRIGEVVLSKLEVTDWYPPTVYEKTISFQWKDSIAEQVNSKQSGKSICNKIPRMDGSEDVFHCRLDGCNPSRFTIWIDKSKLNTLDEKGLVEWLNKEDVKVVVELKDEVIRAIDLKGQKLSTYNTTTHINASSQEGSLTPTLSHVNPSYPVILKPSTKYSIVADSYSNNHTNSPINFNLGGVTASTTVGNRVSTVTTPSTLTSDKLVMSGRGNKLNNVMVIEGDVVGDEPYFEGMCDSKSPILSNVGKNLFDGELEEGSYTSNGQPTSTNAFLRNKNKFIPFKNTISSNVELILHEYDSKKSFIQATNLKANTPKELDSMTCYINFRTLNANAIDIILSPSSTPTTYEPYKSNILSVNGDKIELTEDMFEQGSIGGQVGKTYDQIKLPAVSNRIRSKSTIKVKPNTTYSIKCKEGYIAWFSIHDANDLYVTSWGFNQNASSLILTTSSSTYGLGVIIQKPTGNITPNEVTNVQLHEVDKTIVLRSLPNGVCDTLNVETGEYVQRIGEKTFSGVNNEGWTIANNGIKANIIAFGYSGLNGATRNTNVLCDTFIYPVSYLEDREGIHTQSGNQGQIYISIFTSKLSTPDAAGFKAWLQANPVTVQYELATPIVSTIDIQGFPYAYKDGHIQLTSGSIEQSLTPIIEYSVPTNRNGQIRSNQKMVEKHQKELDKLQAIILANLVNSQYQQTLTTLNYELSRV